jgi:hypothetical protein
MRLFYALTALLFLVFDLSAQELIIEPAQGNPVFQSQVNQKELKIAAEFEKIIGTNSLDNRSEGPFNNCPPDFIGLLLESGQSMFFDLEIDTLVLGDGGNDGDVINLTNGGALLYGTAIIDTTSLIYTANANFQTSGVDTIKLEFCRADGSDCEAFSYVVTVKRKGKVIIGDSRVVDPETVTEYCLTSEVDFPGDKKCSQFIDCPDNYDGEGQQLFSFTNYNRADTCLLYYANRFPGTDTVCMVICDEFIVCDTFKIPFIIRGDTLDSGDLPFFDDFTYQGPHPNDALWLDDQVYVNRTFAANPPSYGFATFDGVDRKGEPYDFFEGVADKLTSKAIDISDLDQDDNVLLRFYVASKGYGKAPSIKDSLVVEFRDNTGEWVTIDGYEGFLNEPFVGDTVPPFEFKLYKLDQDRFFHSAFQFRFKSYSSPGGMVDLWHVDYVWFGSAILVDDTFNDVAFVNLPSNLMSKYTSMPWWHFEGNESANLNKSIETTIFNHKNLIENLDEAWAILSETETSTTQYTQGDFSLISGVNVPIKEPFTENFDVPNLTFDQQLLSMQGDFVGAENLNFRSTYYLTADQDFEFRSNDTVHLYTPFKNYFAYDDGTAERQISFKTPSGGEQLAVRYTSNVDDTLRAVQILFPHLNGNTQTQIFNLRIYTDELTKDLEPIYEQELLTPFYPNNLFDTIQGFTIYRLEDILGTPKPIFIPAGDFYVTFMQVTSGIEYGIPIGYDANNPCDSCLFVKLNSTANWVPIPQELQQATMLRPVFGDEAPLTTSSNIKEVRALSEVMEIYPNPTSGRLFIQLKEGNYQDYKALIFNSIGQNIDELTFENQIDLTAYQNGIYFLQIVNQKTRERFNHKIILSY